MSRVTRRSNTISRLTVANTRSIPSRRSSFLSSAGHAFGRANRYLAYGAMRRPAPFVIRGEATIELDYFLYNCAQNIPEYEDRGVMTVPTVLQTAWQFRDQSAAWLLLNVGREETRIELTLDPSIDRRTPPRHLHRDRMPGREAAAGAGSSLPSAGR